MRFACAPDEGAGDPPELQERLREVPAITPFPRLLTAFVPCGLLAAAALFAVSAAAGDAGPPRRLTPAEMEDRVRGGWAGQMIGVAYGAPTEFRFLGRTIDGLKPGRHTLRLVTTAADSRSKGRECYLLGAIVYGDE